MTRGRQGGIEQSWGWPNQEDIVNTSELVARSEVVGQSAVVRSTAPFITGRMRLRDKWTVQDFSSAPVFIGNDDTAVLKTAIAECRQAGRVLHLNPGVAGASDLLTDPASRDPLWVCGAGQGESVIEHGAIGKPLFNLSGAPAADITTITAPAAANVATLTLGSTAGLSRYSLLLLSDPSVVISGGEGTPDSEVTDGGSSKVTAGIPGEYVRVFSVDSPTQITIYGTLSWAYTAGSRVRLVSGNYIEDCWFQDFTVDNPAQFTNTNAARTIFLPYSVNSMVRNVEFLRQDAPQVYLYYAAGGRVHECDFIGSTNQASPSLFGYCVAVTVASQNIHMADCNVWMGRHGITCGGGGASEAPAQHVKVSDCTSWHSEAAAWDAHPGARWVTFENCKAINPAFGGYQLRGPDNAVINCHCDGGDRGVYIADGATRARVIGGDFRRCNTGIEIRDTDAVMIGGDARISARTDAIKIVPERAPWAGEMQTLSIDNVLIEGDPTGYALNFGHFKPGFHLGPNVRAPQAARLSTGVPTTQPIPPTASLTFPR